MKEEPDELIKKAVNQLEDLKKISDWNISHDMQILQSYRSISKSIHIKIFDYSDSLNKIFSSTNNLLLDFQHSLLRLNHISQIKFTTHQITETTVEKQQPVEDFQSGKILSHRVVREFIKKNSAQLDSVLVTKDINTYKQLLDSFTHFNRFIIPPPITSQEFQKSTLLKISTMETISESDTQRIQNPKMLPPLDNSESIVQRPSSASTEKKLEDSLQVKPPEQYQNLFSDSEGDSSRESPVEDSSADRLSKISSEKNPIILNKMFTKSSETKQASSSEVQTKKVDQIKAEDKYIETKICTTSKNNDSYFNETDDEDDIFEALNTNQKEPPIMKKKEEDIKPETINTSNQFIDSFFKDSLFESESE